MTTTHHPLHPEDAPVLAVLRQAAAAQRGRIFGARARPAFDAMKAGVAPAPDVQASPGTVGGVPGWWCRPTGARPDARLLYLHGGAYVLGTAEAFRNQVSHFAKWSRAETFAPDYRRAPEHPFPAAVEDCWAVYQAIAGQGVDRIALVGDSAGGALALSVLLRAAAEAGSGLVQPRGAAVMSPWVDLELVGESMRSRSEVDPIFTREVLAAFVGDYLQGQDPRDPRASPLLASLRGLPPLHIDVGDEEILLDDATRLAEAARAAGVEVTLNVWAGMPHTFQSAVGRLRAASQAVEAAGRFLSARLEGGHS